MAIDRYQHIEQPEIEPYSLKEHASTFAVDNQHFAKTFVPSPDLLQSYQSTFTKANQNQRIVNTTNYKLKANFQVPAPSKNMVQVSRVNPPLPQKIKEQPILVEDVEETILKRLKGK